MSAERTPTQRVLAPVIALGAVTAFIGVLLFIGHSPVGTHSAAGHTGLAARFGASPNGSTHGSTSKPAVGRTNEASANAPAAAHHPGHKSSGSGSSGNPSRHRSAATPTRWAVTVLNNSRIQGLAASTAGELQQHGWPIASVGNVHGRWPETTLYYAAGQERAAQLLARQFDGITSVEPRPGFLPGQGLTLVVTRYWES